MFINSVNCYSLQFKIVIINRFITRYLGLIKIKPMKHKLYNIKGKRCAKLGEFETAISFYEKAIFIKPEYFEAHYNLGSAHHKLGHLDLAVRSYKKVVAIKPENAAIHKNSFFIFSIETHQGEGYSLLKSSRYAHSDSYILEVASYGFELVDSQNVKLRKEGNNWINGKIYILKT